MNIIPTEMFMTLKQAVKEPWTGARLVALGTGLLALGGGIGTIIALIAGRIGIAIVGPPEALAAFEVKYKVDSAYVQGRLTDNTAKIVQLDARLQQMERVVEIWTYIQCTEVKRRDPAALPRSCNEVLGQ